MRALPRIVQFAFLPMAVALLIGIGLISAQIGPGPPGPEPEPEEQEKPKGSLKPRPDRDADTEKWLKKLGAVRPTEFAVQDGVMLHLVLSPDGSRLYYYRPLPERNPPAKPEDESEKAAKLRYALYTVGPEKPETKILETGIDTAPPIFLPDGRLLVTVRKQDLNDDGTVDAEDEHSLMACNRDGGALREIDLLKPSETLLAAWKDGKEVLLADYDGEELNGWIQSLNLVRRTRTRVVRAFNVELVLEDGRLLIERMLAAPEAPPQQRGWGWWGRGEPIEEEEKQPNKPTLLGHTAHLIFDPADGSTTPLYSPGRSCQIVVRAEGSFFGHQQEERKKEQSYIFPRFYSASATRQGSELLVVDDPAHRDTRYESQRYDYLALGWIQDRGLLFSEQAHLGVRLRLMDRALKFHTLAEFDLDARGMTLSADGLTIAYLRVEDTDKNGLLEPWKDHSRPYIVTLK